MQIVSKQLYSIKSCKYINGLMEKKQWNIYS